MSHRADCFKLRGSADLHFIYGVNCFQYAMGFHTPVMSILARGALIDRPELTVVAYAMLSPGNAARRLGGWSLFPRNGLKILFQEAAREGLQSTGPELVRREGFRTLALFFNKQAMDFHFAVLEPDGRWSSKVPFDIPRTYESVEDVAKAEEVAFASYMLAPEGYGQRFAAAHPSLQRAAAPGGGEVILLEQGDVHAANRMMFNAANGMAALVKSENMLVPLPAWPLVTDDSSMTAPSAGLSCQPA